jgi:hypothetical protein
VLNVLLSCLNVYNLQVFQSRVQALLCFVIHICNLFCKTVQLEQILGVEVLCLCLEVFYLLSTGGDCDTDSIFFN